MAWFPKIDEKEDFQYLKRFIDTWAVRCKNNLAAYVDYAEMFDRLQAAFNDAIQAEEVEVAKGLEKPKAVPKKKKEEVVNFRFCPDHPSYQAKRSPRTDCKGCWEAFEKYAGRSRAKQARQKFERKVNG